MSLATVFLATVFLTVVFPVAVVFAEVVFSADFFTVFASVLVLAAEAAVLRPVALTLVAVVSAVFFCALAVFSFFGAGSEADSDTGSTHFAVFTAFAAFTVLVAFTVFVAFVGFLGSALLQRTRGPLQWKRRSPKVSRLSRIRSNLFGR